jgi:hypothetical protein
MSSKNPFIERRKMDLFANFIVDTSNPIYILEDGRKVLRKFVSSDDDACLIVEKNWKVCKNDRQEFDCILWSLNKEEYDCVIVCKNYTKYGVFNSVLKRIIVPVEYKQEQLRFDENGVYVTISPYADKAYTYQGKEVDPW